MRPLFQRRHERGAYNTLMAELYDIMDLESDATYHQIESRRFDFLLSLVNEDITGQPGFRLPVPADMKLAVTLRKLFR